MAKSTLMVFAHPSCTKGSKVSFQLVDTDLDDLESGMDKVSSAMESGKLEHGKVFPLWGYVHVSADTTEDDEWDLEI